MKNKILITGAAGFLGTNLLLKLSKNKRFIIHGLIKSRIKTKNKIKNIKYIKCNLLNLKELKKKLNFDYDYVINLAGNINHKKKFQTFNANLIGLKNLIKVINLKKIKLFIHVGRSLEYGAKKSPQIESKSCKPTSYYGISKFLATKLIQEKIKNYLILRLYQVYGPHQKINRLIPITIQSCIKNISFSCTLGNQLRDFLFVDDFVNLIINILKRKKIQSGIYNVGSGQPVKVKKIINLVKKILKKGKPVFGKIKMREDEIKILYPKLSKIKNNFNWNHKINLYQGLKKTIKFYKKSKYAID